MPVAGGGLARGTGYKEWGKRSRTNFTRWVRTNSEHYLLLDSQARLAARYGRPAPPGPHGAQEFFWMRIFAPVYRRLPWKFRAAVIARMPGSHRRDWSAGAPRVRRPAV
jgi:hypothetical protein